MGNAIASADQETPEWLTAVLREQGTLPEGRVTAVTQAVDCLARLHALGILHAKRSVLQQFFDQVLVR